jgi:hypothetical protein
MKTKWRRGYQRDAAGRLSGGQALGASLGTILGSIVRGAALHQHGRIQQVQQLARLGDLPLGGGSEDRTEQRADAGLCQRHHRDDRVAGLPSAAASPTLPATSAEAPASRASTSASSIGDGLQFAQGVGVMQNSA